MLAATPEPWAQVIARLLTEAGFTVDRLSPEAAAPQERTVLIYSRPEYTVEHAIEQGADVDPAIDRWVREAKLVTDLFRRNRSTVTVLHGPTLVTNPDLFHRWAKDSLGVTVSEQVTTSGGPQAAALSRVIAAQ